MIQIQKLAYFISSISVKWLMGGNFLQDATLTILLHTSEGLGS